MKTVPAGGDIIAGNFVPGGTAVGQNLFPLMRDRELWGADAGVFRPERWLEAGEEERAAMERLVDLCFGSGRFGCAGRALAWMEMGKVFFEVSAFPCSCLCEPRSCVPLSLCMMLCVNKWLICVCVALPLL